jgi:hypothetical protein
MRHLTPSFAIGALRRGKQIEQFLGGFDHGDDHILRWTALCPGRAGITLYFSEVLDVGSETFLDISEFPPLDRNNEAWGERIGTVITGPEDALALAERALGAARDRWVNQGVVCSEYQDYRTARNNTPSPNL